MRQTRLLNIMLLGMFFWLGGASAATFDHGYRDYNDLLQAHVQWTDQDHASAVDYTKLKKNEASLDPVLSSLSKVEVGDFSNWSMAQQMAFLINAYNAFTLKLILSEYPDLDSIKDLGSLLRSPWKKSFFTLLGKERNLDWIEHERLRPVYKDPRVHFAVNCASIGCPALRPEAFVAEQLNAQLDDQQKRFLSDRSRNHFDPQSGVLSVSPIFNWFSADFEIGTKKVKDWMSARASLLADDEKAQSLIRQGQFKIKFGEYDWKLNDVPG